MSEEAAVLACVECHFFKGPENLYAAQMSPAKSEPECLHPQAVTRDLIYGKAYCRAERNEKKGCGKQGKLWASKTNAKSA